MNMIHVIREPITWFRPDEVSPPFNIKILMMMASQTSHDAGRTYHTTTEIITGMIADYGEDDPEILEDFLKDVPANFREYQFCILTGPFEEVSDFYSDDIIAWAYYPVDVETAALKKVEGVAA